MQKETKKMSKIQILVNDHKATITHILPGYSVDEEKEFIICVEFGRDNPYNTTTSMGVPIPAKHYTREELIKVTTKAAIKKVDKDQKLRKKCQKLDEERIKFENFTKKVGEELGLILIRTDRVEGISLSSSKSENIL